MASRPRLEAYDAISLGQLDAFVESARRGSFSEAAQRLGVTQPAISMRIGKLEDRLETLLFRRGGSRTVLTSAGEQLLPYAQRALTSARKGFRAARQQQS